MEKRKGNFVGNCLRDANNNNNFRDKRIERRDLSKFTLFDRNTVYSDFNSLFPFFLLLPPLLVLLSSSFLAIPSHGIQIFASTSLPRLERINRNECLAKLSDFSPSPRLHKPFARLFPLNVSICMYRRKKKKRKRRKFRKQVNDNRNCSVQFL